jgi:hypothetical protein
LQKVEKLKPACSNLFYIEGIDKKRIQSKFKVLRSIFRKVVAFLSKNFKILSIEQMVIA